MSANVNLWNVGKLLVTCLDFIVGGWWVADGSWAGFGMIVCGAGCLALLLNEAADPALSRRSVSP